LRIHNSTLILKFYLHISPEEQKERLLERIEQKEKHWKYNENDFKEAEYWKSYRKMYEDVFENCNEIPWNIVAADQNWYKEYVVTKVLVDSLKSLDMKYPELEEKN